MATASARKSGPAPSAGLADRLLEAQVEFVIGELSGDRLAENIARDVDDVLEVAAMLQVGEIVDAEQVKATLRKLVVQVGGSPIVEDFVGALSDAIYDLPASDDFHLGEVLDRDSVSALIAKVLSMHTLHERLLDRLTESPVVATVASRFVTKIVSDFLQQNRARAEKLPGMSSLLSMGTSAASRVRNATDRHVDQFLGDAAGKGALYALRRTNNAILELLRESPLQEAALEIWDLHADEPIGQLREYLTDQDLRELALIVHELVVNAGRSEYTGLLLDACVDVFFERYGKHDVAALVSELGVTRDDLVEDITAFAPPVIEAAKADGVLSGHVRRRLEPFFRSAAVRAMLAEPASASA